MYPRLLALMIFLSTSALWAESHDGTLLRSIPQLYQSQTLERKLQKALNANKHLRYTATLFLRIAQEQVVVIGSVEERTDIQTIQHILAQKAPSMRLKMYIHVVPERQDIFGLCADAWLTMKTRLTLLQNSGWIAGRIRVVTHRGTIYLIGPVHQIQRSDRAMIEKLSQHWVVIT